MEDSGDARIAASLRTDACSAGLTFDASDINVESPRLPVESRRLTW